MIIQNETQWLAYTLAECLQGATPIPFDSETYRLPIGTKPVVKEAKSWVLLPSFKWFTLEDARVSVEVYGDDAKLVCKRLDYEFYGYPYSKTTSNKPDKTVTSDLIKIVNRLIEKDVPFHQYPEDRETFRVSPNATGVNRDEILFAAVLGNIVHGVTDNNGTNEIAFKTQRSAVLQQLGQGLEEMMLLTEILRLAKTVIFDQEKSILEIQFAKRLPVSLKEWVVKVPLLNIATLVDDGQSLQYNRTNSTIQHLLTIVSIIKYLNLETVLQITETDTGLLPTLTKEKEMNVKEVPSALKSESTTIPEGFILCRGQPASRAHIDFDTGRDESRDLNTLPEAIAILTEFKETFKPEYSAVFTPEFYAHALIVKDRSVAQGMLRDLTAHGDSIFIDLFRTISPMAELFIRDGAVGLEAIAEFVQQQEEALTRFFKALVTLNIEPNAFHRLTGSVYRQREEKRDRSFPIFTRDRDQPELGWVERQERQGYLDRKERNRRANLDRREREAAQRVEDRYVDRGERGTYRGSRR